MATRNTTNRDLSAPADNTKTLPFECTYANCITRFETLKEMKYHKVNHPDHYYCKKCDLDFEDWDALTQHKVTMMSPWVDGPMKGNREVLPNHIVCEFCGIEYKTFGARRVHREQVRERLGFLVKPVDFNTLTKKQTHPAEQKITCPMTQCKRIFTKAAAFVRHLEDGHCEGVTAAHFWGYVEQAHVNKQISKDLSTISGRLEENRMAAEIQSVARTEHTDTEYGGVALSATPSASVIDAEDEERLQRLYRPLQPEQDLISPSATHSPSTLNSPVDWPALSTEPTSSMRSMSISSAVPSVNGTELSASQYARTISELEGPSQARRGARGASARIESFPPLCSPSYASSVTSNAESKATKSAGDSKAQSAWTSENASRALFPDARSTPNLELDEESSLGESRDIRDVRWYDPDHEDFEPDVFRSNNLMASITFSCPFPDCVDVPGYDNIDTLKAHLRLAHLAIDFRCPSCKKKFAKPSALVAHTESHGNCKVQGSGYFKSLIADMSAGFLTAKRLLVPQIFRKDSAMVLANGRPVDGIMQTEFKAKLRR